MILVTHAAIGATTALFLRHYPILGIIAAFASHFISDAIPHWHYQILSRRRDPNLPFGDTLVFDNSFLKDIIRTGIDFGLGLIIVFLSTKHLSLETILLALAGASAGVLPDLLQAVYYKFPNSPLVGLQKFHRTIHSKIHLDSRPFIGITSQVAIIVLCSYLLIGI